MRSKIECVFVSLFYFVFVYLIKLVMYWWIKCIGCIKFSIFYVHLKFIKLMMQNTNSENWRDEYIDLFFQFLIKNKITENRNGWRKNGITRCAREENQKRIIDDFSILISFYVYIITTVIQFVKTRQFFLLLNWRLSKMTEEWCRLIEIKPPKGN